MRIKIYRNSIIEFKLNDQVVFVEKIIYKSITLGDYLLETLLTSANVHDMPEDEARLTLVMILAGQCPVFMIT